MIRLSPQTVETEWGAGWPSVPVIFTQEGQDRPSWVVAFYRGLIYGAAVEEDLVPLSQWGEVKGPVLHELRPVVEEPALDEEGRFLYEEKEGDPIGVAFLRYVSRSRLTGSGGPSSPFWAGR